ncbi:CDP-2,3-bis-(O-geranylgeranyl)-sn-glycerol synthase [Methanocella sp.]|uniref:CDP-2,3-bis-(O-geranylgeranyl)-sn-glycerol synthase n=1 Tax=Methanocella sp. TaxID=2052833 RepID=UPI0032C21B1A
MMPAYIANPAAALLGGGKPIDQGRNFTDNKRILGDGKTIRGFILGSLCGTLVGLLQILIAPYIAPYLASYVSADMLMNISYVSLFTMPVGALLGDMVKSFFKRRLGYQQGAMMPIADQLDFVAGAWVLTLLLDPSWFFSSFTLDIIVTVLVITPVLHLTTNFIGFKIGKKNVPW